MEDREALEQAKEELEAKVKEMESELSQSVLAVE